MPSPARGALAVTLALGSALAACNDDAFVVPAADAAGAADFAVANDADAPLSADDVPPVAPPCGGAASVSGRALALESGGELAGAKVCVVGCGSCAVTTVTGQFTLADVPGDGPVQLEASASGRVPVRLHLHLPGTVAAPLVLRLPTPATVLAWGAGPEDAVAAVWLLDGPGGAPVGGARVQLAGSALAPASLGPGGAVAADLVTTHGATGAALLIGLPAGPQAVHASHLARSCAAAGASWPARGDGAFPFEATPGVLATLALTCPPGALDLQGLDAHGQDHCHVDLSGASLREANLLGARLCFARLRDADLTNATLTGVDFTGADLAGAMLVGAETLGAVWSQTVCPDGEKAGDCEGHGTCPALITGAACPGVQLRGLDLAGRYLADVDLENATLEDVDLSGATLTGANFSGAALDAVDFSGADLEGAVFYGSSACGDGGSNNFSGATCPDGTQAPAGGGCDGHLCP